MQWGVLLSLLILFLQGCHRPERLTDSERCRHFKDEGIQSQCSSNEPITKLKKQAFLRQSFPSLGQLHSEKKIHFRSWVKSKTSNHRENISESLRSIDSTGVLRKLLLNESSVPLRSIMLRHLGFVHVLTAAGVHLYFLLSFIFYLLNRIPVRWVRTPAVLRFFAILFVSLVVFQCLYLSGFRPGFLRPIFVFAVRFYAKQKGFQFSSFLFLFGLSFVEGLIFGWGLDGQTHYLLSVGGVWFAIYSTKNLKNLFLRGFLLSWGSFIGVALVSIIEEGVVALGVPVWNMLSYPLFVILIYPLLVLGSFLPNSISALYYQSFLFKAFNDCIQYLTDLAQFVPFNVWIVPEEMRLIFLLMFISLLLFLILIQFKNAFLFICSICFLSFFIQVIKVKKTGCDCALQVEVLDVGQGDALFVQYETKEGKILNGMIDVGRPEARSPSQWWSWAMSRGIIQFDFVVLTHADQDHWGGLKDLRKEMKIQCVVMPTDESKRLPKNLVQNWVQDKIQDPLQGVQPPCVPFPHTVFRNPSRKVHRNEVQVAWMFQYGKSETWMGMGDANTELELYAEPWFRRHLDDLASPPKSIPNSKIKSVWFGGHHGSKTSGSVSLYRSLGIDRVVISSQWMGQYGHPHAEFLERVAKSGAEIYRTDRMGGKWLKKRMTLTDKIIY